MKKLFLILTIFAFFVGCAEIKPMQMPEYNAPDFSSLKRPDIPKPVEGKDYTIDTTNNTITYTITGQDLLTAKTISEKTAWQIVEMLKQVIGIQTEIIKQKDQLIVVIDLKRQYAERGKTYSDIEKYAAEIIGLILAALVIAGK
jgi:hypothetical protein